MEQRKILFKAKKLSDGQWVKGYYYEECGNTYIIENRQEKSMLNRNHPHQVDPSTVCQFTGLKDGKGQDVYENDILELIDNTNIKVCIEWREHRYVLKEVDKEILHLALQRTLDDLVVVGNKFDRKEEK